MAHFESYTFVNASFYDDHYGRGLSCSNLGFRRIRRDFALDCAWNLMLTLVLMGVQVLLGGIFFI